MELIVVHDDVSVIGRAGCREVELLGWDVAWRQDRSISAASADPAIAMLRVRARSMVCSKSTDTKIRRSIELCPIVL